MFIWSAFAHLIALTSPGPDTAIVIRQVSIHGRIEGIKTAIGIGFGILAHCILAISGISLLILANDLYKFIISLIGGIYILYLGVTMYSSINNELPNNNNFLNVKNNSFYIGLITNIFNVKAFLFFVSLFAILMDNLNGIYLYLYRMLYLYRLINYSHITPLFSFILFIFNSLTAFFRGRLLLAVLH